MTGRSGSSCARIALEQRDALLAGRRVRRKFMSWITTPTSSRRTRRARPPASPPRGRARRAARSRTTRAVLTASLSSITRMVRSPSCPKSLDLRFLHRLGCAVKEFRRDVSHDPRLRLRPCGSPPPARWSPHDAPAAGPPPRRWSRSPACLSRGSTGLPAAGRTRPISSIPWQAPRRSPTTTPTVVIIQFSTRKCRTMSLRRAPHRATRADLLGYASLR